MLGNGGGRRALRRRCSIKVGRRKYVVNRFVLAADANVVGRLWCRLELRSLCEARPRRSILLEDAPTEEIRDGLALFRFVEAEHVVKAAIFADDGNNMLDWRTCAADPLLV